MNTATTFTLPDQSIFQIHYRHSGVLGQLRNARVHEQISDERAFFNQVNIVKFNEFNTLAELLSYMLGFDECLPIPAEGLYDGTTLRTVLSLLASNPEKVFPDTLRIAKSDLKVIDFALRHTSLSLAEISTHTEIDLKINSKLLPYSDLIKNITVNYNNYNDEIDGPAALLNIFNLFAEIIDLTYWKMDADLDTNLTASNVSAHKIIYHLCDLLGLSDDRQRIMGRLDPERITTIFGGIKLLSWNRPSDSVMYELTTDSNIMKMISILFTNLKGDNDDLEKRMSTLDHILNRRTREVIKFSLAHWEYILKYLTWFNEMHRHVDGGDVTTHHGHTFLDAFITSDVSGLDLTKPPVVLFEDKITAAHQSIIVKYRLVPFPQLPDDLKVMVEELGFEHIDMPSRLATEGSYMGHCAGGEGYINNTNRGESWFFHLNVGPATPVVDRNSYVERGVTVELTLNDNKFVNNQSKAFQNKSPDSSQIELIREMVQRLNQYGEVKENSNWIKDAIAKNDKLTNDLRSSASYADIRALRSMDNAW